MIINGRINFEKKEAAFRVGITKHFVLWLRCESSGQPDPCRDLKGY